MIRVWFAMVLFAVVIAPLSAQSIVRTVVGTRPGGMLGQVVKAAGDLDADGVSDVLLCEPDFTTAGGSGQPRVLAVSGATGATIHAINGTSAFDAITIGDTNGDGRRELAITGTALGGVRVCSGLSGAQLFIAGGNPLTVIRLADVGDVNGDGRGDFAGLGNQAGIDTAWLFSGNGGTVLGSIPGLFMSGSFDPKIRELGDVNGDGRRDFLIGNGGSAVHVCTTVPLQIANTITLPAQQLGRYVLGADVTGDGVAEVLAQGTMAGTAGVFAFVALTGALVRTYPPLPLETLGAGLARIGDLDADLADEFVAVETTQSDPLGRLVVFSGRTGARLGAINGELLRPTLVNIGYSSTTHVDGTGDVNGDGFGDFVGGFVTQFDGSRGGYRLVSGKLLADVAIQGGACGFGPFPVQLGVTRPILGQTATVVCRDGPVATPGGLALSMRPASPTWLGASSCTAFVDLGGLAITPTTGATWSVGLPVPLAPTLAGFEVALQAFYGPTQGPLGMDLSNGLWARLGF